MDACQDWDDFPFLRRAFEVAREARRRGDHPFGALLVHGGQVLLEQGNVVETERDATGHAELVLVRKASALFDGETLRNSCLYSSAEPCAMCSGGIHWCGIGRLVYGLSEADLRACTGSDERNRTLDLPCRAVLASGGGGVDVIGPLLEVEAREVHRDFWR